MSILKKIPLTYLGELHHVRLVNFWVNIEEVLPLVPKPLRVRNFNGKALISMVNVELEKMRPSFLPEALNFHYRHVAFRLLLDDSEYNEDKSCRGIYFLRSFSDRSDVVAGGNLLTDYRLEKAEIRNLDRMMELRQDEHYFNYALDLAAVPGSFEAFTAEQRTLVGALDRAYSVDEDGRVKMIRIMREKWPIHPVQCYLAETNFFKTAHVASAFVVDEIIPYQWNAPQFIDRHAS